MNKSIRKLRFAAEASVLAIELLMSPAANADDDLMRTANQIFHPIPSVIPAVKDNSVTHGRVYLGKMLFLDPRLSASEIMSCNTCRNLGTGGVDPGPTSVGHVWKVGLRRAPTVYNAVFKVAPFWHGRAADLKAQATGPVQASAEMSPTPNHVLDSLNAMASYVALVKNAFPNEARPVTFENYAKAIEANEAALISPAAPFDQYVEGNTHAPD
ncbi:cytochrome c peroxidase [Bradyrhizobium sp. i1.15.2]|uniref:cytochrome-c peroxidase n=1 Tax=Bradyrhizobium sp. i1.15.2 TaxID=3156362 RepID=UPI003398A33E